MVPTGTIHEHINLPKQTDCLISHAANRVAVCNIGFDGYKKAMDCLKPGDVVRAHIASADGAIDLGEQRHVVKGASA